MTHADTHRFSPALPTAGDDVVDGDDAVVPSFVPLATLSTERQAFIRRLQHCATACEHCAAMAPGAPDASERLGEVCRDAAALCALVAQMLARQSNLAPQVTVVAEAACRNAADECESRLESIFGECARQCREVLVATERARRDDSDTAPATPAAARRS
jgi:hypothetical protein